MTWAYVGGAGNNTGANLAYTVVNAGCCLFAVGLASNSNGSITFTDGTSSFTTDFTTADIVNGVKMSIASFPNHSGTGGVTITPTPSVGAMLALAVVEYTGMATSSPLDTTQGNSAFGTSMTSNAVSPATGAANELVLGAAYDSGGSPTGAFQTFSAGSGFTSRQTPSIGFMIEDKDSGASGSTPAATFTSDKAFTYWLAAAVVYKIAAAAGFIPLTGEGGLGGMRLAGSGGLAG